MAKLLHLFIFLFVLCHVSCAVPLPPAVYALPLGAVRPQGWLEEVLLIQRNGLAGHLSRFYADVKQSTWLGGNATENGGIRERLPYWLNGAVPLAYLLPDDRAQPQAVASAVARRSLLVTGQASSSVLAPGVTLPRSVAVLSGVTAGVDTLAPVRDDPFSLRDEVNTMISYILANQTLDGWLGGPQNDDASDPDQYWLAWEVLWSLLQLAEAEPSTADTIKSSLLRYIGAAYDRMGGAPMDGWSQVRFPEYVAILHAVHDAFALNDTERELVANATDRVFAQGFDWTSYFNGSSPLNFTATLPWAPAWTLTEHGVNHAMALKEGAVAWRHGGGDAAVRLSSLKVRMLDAAHGMPSGSFSADECLAGREPNRGVELCVLVEEMWSLAHMARVHGDVGYADRAERIAYNALPGAISEDAWAHNYLSQSNSIFAGHTERHPWKTDPADGTMMGLAPVYGCCTANHGQGWPKFAQGVMGHNGSAIFVVFYAPATATFPSIIGGGTRVTLNTRYPFGDSIEVHVTSMLGVDVMLRVPGWAGAATLWTNASPRPTALAPGAFHAVHCRPGACRLVMRLTPAVTVTPSGGGGVSIHRGPLLFALPLEEQWSQLKSYAFSSADWEVATSSAWAVALRLRLSGGAAGGDGQQNAQNATAPVLSHDFAVSFSPPPLDGDSPWAAARPRVTLKARVRPLPSWTSPDGGKTAGELPPSPACADEPCGEEREVTLVPFGNTRLRIAVFPYTLV